MCVSRHAIQPFVSVSARACRLHQRFAVFIGLPLTYWPLCYAPSCRNVVTECSWGRLTVMPGRIQRMPPSSARLSCSPFCSSALTRRIGAAVFILSRIKERSSAKRRMCALLWHQFCLEMCLPELLRYPSAQLACQRCSTSLWRVMTLPSEVPLSPLPLIYRAHCKHQFGILRLWYSWPPRSPTQQLRVCSRRRYTHSELGSVSLVIAARG